MKKSLFTLCLFCLIQTSLAQPGTVQSTVDFLNENPKLMTENPDDIGFGRGVHTIDDIDGDGIRELAVNAQSYTASEGIVYICFLGADRKVKKYTRIGRNIGGLNDELPNDMLGFGNQVIGLGDLDKDGVADIAISCQSYDGISRGEFIIAFLNSDGTIKASKTIKPNAHGFNQGLNPDDQFGCSLANIGDLNGDGNPELLVGARRNSFDHQLGGAAFILYLNSDGTILKHKLINQSYPNFPTFLNPGSVFGTSVAHIRTIGQERIIAIGASGDSVDGHRTGSFLLLRIDSGAKILESQIIAFNKGGFTDSLYYQSGFGSSLAGVEDIDGDGNYDVAVGAPNHNDGGPAKGAIWILFLNSDLSVKTYQRISETRGNLGLNFDNQDNFGRSISSVGDWNGDGRYDIVVTTLRFNNPIGLISILELNGVDHTGLKTYINTDLIKIFPNPSDQRLIAETGSDGQRTVQIVNIEGKTVYHQTIGAGNTRFELDVSGFENGIYLMSIQSGNAVSRSKFIVQH